VHNLPYADNFTRNGKFPPPPKPNRRQDHTRGLRIPAADATEIDLDELTVDERSSLFGPFETTTRAAL
jgi:hypothetical protein